jgi:molecular chaperone GrpE (heat shock protein)
MCNKGMNVELESLFNFPLGPTEFKKAWNETFEKYGIKEHPTIKSLFDKRQMSVMAYFKGLSCGRMTPTQISESRNRALKDGYVNSVTSLHQFAEKILEVLQHMDHIDVEKSHCSQVKCLCGTRGY